MNSIRVLIVDDDIDWQKGIIELLNKEIDISIVAVASNKEEAIKIINSLNVDIVLMDINLHDNLTEGIRITAEISDLCKTKIIMLTSYNSEDMIIKSFTAGASNFVLKSDFKKIPETIRETFNSCTPVEVLAKNHAKLQKELYLNKLTSAERQIYDFCESGYTLRDIEDATKKSSNTIRNQINSILSKLGAKNMQQSIKRSQLIERAISAEKEW